LRTLVILPTYNEVASLEETVRQTLDHNNAVEILIVDDASPDGTGALAERLSQENPKISVLHRAKKEGLGPAYLAGFARAIKGNFDFIVEMDADGSHRAEDLQKLLNAAAPGTLVIGSRWVTGGEVANWSRSRVAISRVGNRYASWMLQSKVHDMTAGFRVFSRDLLEKIITEDVAAHGYAFQVELAKRSELVGKVVEVPITFIERAQGKSKMSLRIVIEALWLITKWGLTARFARTR
jgi:glycosyltransferase involved in cell wall biosynthesis